MYIYIQIIGLVAMLTPNTEYQQKTHTIRQKSGNDFKITNLQKFSISEHRFKAHIRHDYMSILSAWLSAHHQE